MSYFTLPRVPPRPVSAFVLPTALLPTWGTPDRYREFRTFTLGGSVDTWWMVRRHLFLPTRPTWWLQWVGYFSVA